MICRRLLRRLVVTCIRTSRKIKPVVGAPELLKTPLQVITARAAQTEKTSGPALGQATIGGGKLLSRRAKWGLVILGLLASLSLAISFPDYIHSRPNTVAVALAGPFDAERAFAGLKRMAAFGPEPSGSQASERTREFITGQLSTVGVTVSEGRFTASTPIGAIPIVNLIARIPGASPSVVILAGHYDTKRMDVRFVGANDGASSAAFLLETARVLARRNNKLTYPEKAELGLGSRHHLLYGAPRESGAGKEEKLYVSKPHFHHRLRR